MTGLTDCGDLRHALGVYVVGAIEPAERAVVEAHLSRCPGCREELVGLAGLPALLGRVPPGDAERLALGAAELEEPPAQMLDALLRQVAARRRARRWRAVAAAAAAAVIAIGGGIAGGALLGGARHAAPPASAEATSYLVHGSNQATHVAAAVYYRSSASGITMQVQVTGIRNGTHCVFWVINPRGQHIAVGDWTVNSRTGNWFRGSSTLAMGQVRGFDITVGAQRLVTIPAAS